MANSITAKQKLVALCAAGFATLAITFWYFYNQTLTVNKWQPNHSYLYSVNFKMEGEQYANHFLNMNSRSELNMQGHVRFDTPSDMTGETTLNAYIRFDALTYKFNQQSIISADQQVEELPILVNLNNGKVSDFSVPEAHKYYIDIVREFLTFFDFKQPQLLPDSWNSVEQSAQTDYPIQYALSKPWYGSKTNMQTEYLGQDDYSAEYEGNRNYTFDSKGLLESNAKRQRRFRMADKLVSKDATDFELKLVSISQLDDFAPLIFNEVYQEDLISTTQLANESLLRKMNVLGDATFEDVLAAMAAVTDKEQATAVARKLVALLTVHPEKLEQVIEELNLLEIDDLRFGMITSSLQYLGTPEIQNALIREIQNLNNDEDFRRKDKYITALAFVDKPTDESFEYFRETFTADENDKLKSRSAMAMGIVASRTDNPEVKRETANMLIDEYQGSDKNNKVLMLRSLSNAGLESTEGFLTELAHTSTDKKIASEAIKALRKINTPTSSETLNEFIGSSTLEYRDAAVSAYRYQSISSSDLNVLGQRLYKESNNAVARKLISVIGSYKGNREQAKRILNNYLNYCSDYKLCNVAKSTVNGL